MSQELGSQTLSLPLGDPFVGLPESQGPIADLLQLPAFSLTQDGSQQDQVAATLTGNQCINAAHSAAPFPPLINAGHQQSFYQRFPSVQDVQQHAQQQQLTSYSGNLSYPAKSRQSPPRQPHHSLQKIEHKGSRASRRGPMDEMRQLVRILVKFIPKSAEVLNSSLDNGGGNRVSEEQIKNYLQKTLGEEAPQPEWGLPEGWGHYLSELLCWALDRPVTREQAMTCARRQQGRSWEIVESAVRDLDGKR